MNTQEKSLKEQISSGDYIDFTLPRTNLLEDDVKDFIVWALGHSYDEPTTELYRERKL